MIHSKACRFSAALAACVLCAASQVRTADALSVTLVPGSVNDGTRTVTTFSPLTVTQTHVNTPYGTASIAPSGGGFLITFIPLNFLTHADNLAGSMTNELDGKIDFTLVFDHAINLTATINEGGIYAIIGHGMAGVVAGASIAEADHPQALETIIDGNLLATFNNDNTWSGTETITGFQNNYFSYQFSVDNYLIAQGFGEGPSAADIAKSNFSITITPGGPDNTGTTPGAPLPPAMFSGLGLGGLALLFRRRR